MGNSWRLQLRRFKVWRERVATRLYVWLFNEPPVLDGSPWRITYWCDGQRWHVYVFKNAEWFGVGVRTSLNAAMYAATAACRQKVRSRRQHARTPDRTRSISRVLRIALQRDERRLN